MKRLEVACAIVERAGLVLATQRGAAMSLPLKWEFPGGKIDPGESPADCLRRELREELGVEITVGEALAPHTHSYPAFTVTLHPYRCAIGSGAIELHEHAAAAWIEPGRLEELDWAEADLPVVAEYLTRRKSACAPGPSSA